ncbi:MAG: hypothetical protein Q4A62_10240 [Eikenella sp.]|nr:hypothetical protein [Eikenella sp.]
MKRKWKTGLAAGLIALAVPASAQSDGGQWRVVFEQHRQALLWWSGTLAAAIDWERDALLAGRTDADGVEKELFKPQTVAWIFRRSSQYLQHEIKTCYEQAAEVQAAEQCSKLDNILAAHLASDHAYHQQRGRRFAFTYLLHERTREWNQSHAERLQVLKREAAEARHLFRAQLSAAPAGAEIHRAVERSRQYVRDQLDQWADAPSAP